LTDLTDTAYEKYCQYLHQYSKSITDTIGSNTNTEKLTTMETCNINRLVKTVTGYHFSDCITGF